MTALAFDSRPKRHIERGHPHCMVHACVRAPRFSAYILDTYVGQLCRAHHTEWTRSWDIAAGKETRPS